MAQFPDEFDAVVRRLRAERDKESRLPPEMCGLGADDCEDAADVIERQAAEITELRAEVERLRDGLDAIARSPKWDAASARAAARSVLNGADFGAPPPAADTLSGEG